MPSSAFSEGSACSDVVIAFACDSKRENGRPAAVTAFCCRIKLNKRGSHCRAVAGNFCRVNKLMILILYLYGMYYVQHVTEKGDTYSSQSSITVLLLEY